jgi:lipopolysaccharide/colanic/teichoic acid biosynthesis glycosyltransferase
MKRLFDIIISSIGLLILSPLLIFIAIIIKVDSKGPVFYLSERIGKMEKPFKLIKFRSMKPNSDKNGSFNVSLKDDRVTNFGKFLRTSKIDEIPQLINVFAGEMSLVGPRPDIKAFTNLYSQKERKILSLKPGITDWASLVNAFQYKEFNKSIDPDKLFMEKIRPIKVKLQLYYLNHSSFLLDLEIIIWTFLILIFRVKKLPSKISTIIQ